MSIIILGIESSCDDTSASIVKDGFLLSNIVSGQQVHEIYGGVIPELASRAHQQNIIPTVDMAVKQSGIGLSEISAVAFTRGPGLMGSLLVGVSFAKGFSLARGCKMIDVNHLQGHVLSCFINESDNQPPSFPFLCLLVSGGHTQLIKVTDHLEMEIIGQSIDDAAGEAFDKCAKLMGLPYPGGPHIDALAKLGNANAFRFNKPRIEGLNFSFSGLKTSFLYFLQDQLRHDPLFIENNKADLCASLQNTIVEILVEKSFLALNQTKIKQITLAGGVSANSSLRSAMQAKIGSKGYKVYLPAIKYTTDNAAMIATTGYFKYLQNQFAQQNIVPLARL